MLIYWAKHIRYDKVVSIIFHHLTCYLQKTIDFTDIADIAKHHYGVFPNAIKITTLKNKEVYNHIEFIIISSFAPSRYFWFS